MRTTPVIALAEFEFEYASLRLSQTKLLNFWWLLSYRLGAKLRHAHSANFSTATGGGHL